MGQRLEPAAPTSDRANREDLIRIRAVADFQFGKGCGNKAFPDDITVIRSRKTGKVKGIYHSGQLLATLRPADGYLALSPEGATRLARSLKPPSYRVVVIGDVVEQIKKGRNLFAKHVLFADPGIKAGEEVLITDSADQVLATGKAVLTGKEMKRFKIGLAVKVRKGTEPGMED
jgi:uncharacterized protein with predicted RNA binding PUA domain